MQNLQRLALLSLIVAGCAGGNLKVPSPGRTSTPVAPSASQSSTIELADQPRIEPQRQSSTYPGTGKLVDPGQPKEESPSQPVENGFQLDFHDADVSAVIATVIGEGLGASYTIDPAVKGTMSLRSSKPLNPEELLPALEAALRVQDIGLIAKQGTYHIVPIKDAARRVGGLTLASERKAAGYSIQIVTLEYTSPAEMEKILQPFAPPGGVMKADDARNLLVLAGTSQEIASMLDVVRTFDVDWLAGMAYGFYSLNYVDAKTAVSELSEIFADPKSPLAGVVRLVPMGRLNTVLVITPQRKYLEAVETWIKRLDVGGTSAGRRIYVYDVQNGRAEDLARSLNKILSLPVATDDASQLRSGPGGTSRSETLGSGSGFGGNGSLGMRGTSSGAGSTGLSNMSAQGSGGFRDSSLQSGGSLDGSGKQGDLRIVANNDSNSLMVLASPAEFSVIESALLRLDAPSRQVLIEASLAEVTLTDEFRYGIQWSYAGKNGPVTLSSAAAGTVAQAFPGLSYLFTGSSNISAVLNAIEAVTTVRVISSPKLVTLNNHEAQLQVGDEVPITTQSAVSVTNPDAPIVNSVQMQSTGVILGVTPRVNKNGLVQLDIEQEVSNSVPTTTSSINSPTIQQRRLSTTVVVKNGDTIALGGLITESKSKNRSGVPVLEKIPLMGALFRDTHDTKTRTELILLITPRVMRDDSEFDSVMTDLKSEFKSLKGVFAKPPKADDAPKKP